MLNANTHFRTVLTALAVTTALPTIALAQEVDPAATTAAPVATPLTTEPLAVEPAPVVATDPLAPAEVTSTVAAEPAQPAPAPKVERAPKSATPVARTVSPERTQAAPVTAEMSPKVEAPAAAPIAPLPVEEPLPVVPEVAPANADASVYSDLLPIAGAAGLGLIALAALGMMMRRRKPTIVPMDAEAREPAFARAAPVNSTTVKSSWTPTLPAPSHGFAFGTAAPASAGDRVEQALRGPTPDNPFLSLKKRLKRAAFFEQRDRQVRAGLAERVSPMAGLPRRMVEKVQSGFAQPRLQPA